MATSNGVLHEPLLPRGDNEKKACVAVRGFATWVLALLMWAAFLAWVLVLVVFPTVGLRQGTRSSGSSGSSIYGLNGEVLLVFAAPVFFVAVLATIYLEIKPKSTQKKKPQARPRISLWTYPVLVDGLLGVVSAAELLFIIAFISYLVWAITNYVIKDSNLVKRFMEIPLIKTRFMLWQLWTYILGLRVGILGLICMSFLFLPVARGSPLLRLIDIPFEHAVKYHVWLGHLTMALFTFHGLCYVVVWTSQGRLIEELLAWQKFEVANLPGVISLVAGLALWMTSFGYVRLGSFELFFYTHQLYLVFVVFMAFHIGDFSFCICLAGIFLYMLDRFLRFCQSRRAVTALSWRLLPCGTIELLLPKPHCLNYNSLSFIFLNLPNVSWLQWHPFSVSSSPYDACDNISFLIKPLGSWTEKLQKVVKEAASTDSVTSKRGCPLGIEGPYGHESDYYLKYEALVLVAGGIGVSPFVAILRDLLHRYNMNHPNLPREVTLIWAVKSFAELNMINLVQPAIICPDYASRLNLTVQAYVTREYEPDPENAVPCTPDHILTCARMPSQSPMSSLVGTYSNIWMATYVTVSIAGFFIVQGLMQKFYLGSTAMPENENSSSMVSWTIRAGVLLISMLSGMVLFGGLVIFCWNWIESSRKLSKDKASTPLTELETPEVPTSMESLVGTSNTHYGQRPDLKELFDGFAKKWTGLDVGVLVCGPTTLQTSVAAECKFHNTVNLKAREIAFHYHSMIDDQDLGFFANFLGICIFVLVVAYHYVVADPKYEATS